MQTCYKCCVGCDDIRPYGPKGQWVCFHCAFATKEAAAETNAAFDAQLESAGGMVVIGEEIGPYPAEHHPKLKVFLGKVGKQNGQN